MVISAKQFHQAVKSLSIELDNEFLLNEIISVEYQNISYYYAIIHRSKTYRHTYFYTLKPTFNTNFQLL